MKMRRVNERYWEGIRLKRREGNRVKRSPCVCSFQDIFSILHDMDRIDNSSLQLFYCVCICCRRYEFIELLPSPLTPLFWLSVIVPSSRLVVPSSLRSYSHFLFQYVCSREWRSKDMMVSTILPVSTTSSLRFSCVGFSAAFFQHLPPQGSLSRAGIQKLLWETHRHAVSVLFS